MTTTIITQILLLVSLNACGPNPFKTYEKKDPAEDATVALEESDPNKAIDILTKALADDSDNVQYKSILALAYAQRAGVDPLTLAQSMGTSGTGSSSSGNGVTSLFGVMPAATDANIADVDTAVALLVSIPTAQRIAADTLKLAMFQTAALTLRSKQLDTDGDGVLSAAELSNLTAASATVILSQLASAVGAFAGDGSTSSTSQAASTQVTKIQSAIAAEPGDTDQAKLQSYLAKSSSSSP